MTLDVFSEVNYLAAAVAAIAWWILGAIWYAPPVLGRAWQKAAGVTIPAGAPPPILNYVLTLLAYFVTALAIAALALLTRTDTYGEGVLLGLTIGIGFPLMVTFVGLLFEQKKPAWFWINGIFEVLGYTIVAVIVAVWE